MQCSFRLFAFLLALTAAAAAQVGPDVIVGDLTGPGNYGTDGSGIYAYSVGTTSCNIGTQTLSWVAGTNQHPVIAQHFYRLKNGRFEQIGMSWLKHGFTALQGSLCATTQNPCQPSGTGSALGVFCSDPYSSSLNGSQGNGPRSEVNASTGYFPYPIAGSYPSAAPTIGRRIQCQSADIDPAQNAGALYYCEGHYVAPDDAAAGNKNNNASYRRIQFAAGSLSASMVGSTFQQQPAIMAWPANDPTVVVTNVDVPNDGRFIIAKKITSLGGGNFHYEFAVHNLNSDRSGRGFTVNFPAGTVITNAGFKDIPYHSYGSPPATPGPDGTDWNVTINGPSINWATQTYIQNQNANALRWGTLYNFWFDANAASESDESIELFKPEPCPPDPVVPSASGYTLNAMAPFDDPVLTAPVNGPSGDDSSVNVPIGFSFNFFGVNYSTVNFCTNGFLSFTSGSNAWSNTCIPSSGTPNAIIAGYWDDLVAGAGECQYQTLGTAPNRRFVASWSNVHLFSNSGSLQSFKVILDETTNVITSTIIASAAGGSSATRGIENQTGTSGTQASCNMSGSAVAGTSQTYSPYATILPSADLTITGSTAPGGSLTWAVNSNGLGAPVIIVASFDPGPTDMGPYGILNIGFAPGAWVVVADGGGVLQPANPTDVTDACGDFQVTYGLPSGLPPGLTIYNQGAVVSPASIPPPPNGSFHILQLAIINT